MRVVAAPDSFKGSIGAAAAAAALAAGWRDARPADEVICLPLADGGEGTLEVLAAASPAARWHEAAVSGPGAERIAARWLELPGRTHVIELAGAAGLPLLPELDPLGAHTAGVGELISRALDAGARRIEVGLGGSATTDGGTGALTALGARFLDAAGRRLEPGGGPLAGLDAADLGGLRPPPPGGVACLTDVAAPLLGPAGAAAVFGPQKGASPGQVAALQDGLARLAAVLGGQPDQPGAGAAGGTGYGLAAAWGAELLPGSAEIGRIAGLDAALAGADLVITGEGQYDVTSAAGKVVGAVRAAARRAGVPVAVVAGILASAPPPDVGRALALAQLAGGTAAAMAEPARWLRVAGRALAGDPGGRPGGPSDSGGTPAGPGGAGGMPGGMGGMPEPGLPTSRLRRPESGRAPTSMPFPTGTNRGWGIGNKTVLPIPHRYPAGPGMAEMCGPQVVQVVPLMVKAVCRRRITAVPDPS